MHFPQIRDIPDDEWSEAAKIALAEIRAEKGLPTWEPKFHNGSFDFEMRVLKLLGRGKAEGHKKGNNPHHSLLVMAL
jgi:hypothetical protein